MLARSLRDLFLNKPPGVLEKAISPEMGIAAKHKFLSLAEVNEWMDAAMRSYERTAPPKRELLEAPDEPEIPLEERQRRAEILRKLARGIRAANIVSAPVSGPKAIQKHDPDALIAALGGGVRDSKPLREEDTPPSDPPPGG